MTFKEGDRVRVYDAGGAGNYISTIEEVRSEKVLVVKTPGNNLTFVFHQQCRKLVKKASREFWIRICPYDDEHEMFTPVRSTPVCGHCEVIRVREVKEKK